MKLVRVVIGLVLLGLAGYLWEPLPGPRFWGVVALAAAGVAALAWAALGGQAGSAGSGVRESPAPEAGPTASRPDFEALWRAHAPELQAALDGDPRGRALAVWSDTMERDAPAYLEAAHRAEWQEAAARQHAEAVMSALAVGFMAGRGWVREATARAEAAAIGRALREEVRALGVPLDPAGPGLGVAIDAALEAIVRQGIAVGRG